MAIFDYHTYYYYLIYGAIYSFLVYLTFVICICNIYF